MKSYKNSREIFQITKQFEDGMISVFEMVNKVVFLRMTMPHDELEDWIKMTDNSLLLDELDALEAKIRG